jgi:hypothetical protein
MTRLSSRGPAFSPPSPQAVPSTPSPRLPYPNAPSRRHRADANLGHRAASAESPHPPSSPHYPAASISPMAVHPPARHSGDWASGARQQGSIPPVRPGLDGVPGPVRPSHRGKSGAVGASHRLKLLLAGGLLLAAVGVGMGSPDRLKALNPSSQANLAAPGSPQVSASPASPFPASAKDACQQVVKADAALSRDVLSKLLLVPERSPHNTARQILGEPYCLLPPLTVRAGSVSRREAYPLTFDTQAWLVVLYEGEEYAGYAFSLRH